MVKGTMWRYRVGKGGNVIAYCVDGTRRLTKAWALKGSSPDTFDRGQWKKTSDGMVTPKDVCKWLAAPGVAVHKGNHCRGCGFPVAPGNKYCSECLCEEDAL